MTPFYWFSLGILVAVLALVLGYSVGWIQTEMKRRKEVMPQSGLYQVKDDNYKQPEATMTTSMTTEELDKKLDELEAKLTILDVLTELDRELSKMKLCSEDGDGEWDYYIGHDQALTLIHARLSEAIKELGE